jgi:hypothetical protein
MNQATNTLRLGEQPVIIGPSTGWLSAKITPKLSIHRDILQASKASAAEMVWHDSSRREAMLRGESLAHDLDYCSLHLGSFRDFTLPLRLDQKETLQAIASIVNKHTIATATIHPDTTPPHIINDLIRQNIRLGIENMDRDCAFGRTVSDVASMMQRWKVTGVIDLQHAFEVAQISGISCRQLVTQFASMMLSSGGMSHLHVSGEIQVNGTISSRHAPLTKATNKQEILEALEAVLLISQRQIPIILEGDPLLCYPLLDQQHPLSDEEIIHRTDSAIAAMSCEMTLITEFLRSSPVLSTTARQAPY